MSCPVSYGHVGQWFTHLQERHLSVSHTNMRPSPAEVGLTSHRVSHHDEGRNGEGICLQLDILDKVRATVEQMMTHYQDLMEKHYNTKPRYFQVGDLVLRKVTMATRDPSQGKLGSNQEGPYKIVNYHRKGTYYLETLDRQRLYHLWNIEHLRKYYQQQSNAACFIALFSFFHLYIKCWMSKDVKTLRMSRFFLAIFFIIINKTWMHYQKCFSTPYPVGHLNHTMFYLRGGQTIKDTDGYLILEIFPSPTYGMDRRPRIPTVTWSQKFYEVLPTRWTDNQGYRQVPGLKNFFTYRVDGRPRIPMGTWSQKFYEVLPMEWTDDQGYQWVPILRNFAKSYL